MVYEGKKDGKPVLGGIEIEYELLNGKGYFIDGIPDLGCRSSDIPKRFELNENEGVINIEGIGTDSIRKLMIESSFGRKVKQGVLAKLGELASEKDDGASSKGTNLLANLATISKAANPDNADDKFTLTMPVGSKVLAIAGSADDQLRSLFAYYKH